MTAILLLSVIILPWMGAVCIWAVKDQKAVVQHSLAVLFSVITALAAILLLFQPGAMSVIDWDTQTVFGHFTFGVDGLSSSLTVIATFIGSLAVIFSVDYMHGEKALGRYYAMILFFIGAMTGLVLTTNLLLMFFFWEITALCSYALISFYNDDPKAVAGGMKALIMTQLGGVGLLVGALILYSQSGSYDINALISHPGSISPKLLSGLAFGCLIAAAAKSAQFPFQTWLPDAMEAPTPISALIHAATMVNAGVYLLARFYPAFQAVPGWKLAVMLIGMITAVSAAIMAMVSFDLKRVLACSTVSQLGYMVFAVGCGNIFAAQFHLMSHSIFKALLFLAAGAVIHAVGTRDMRQMGGLGKQMPFTKIVFMIGSLALAGIPLLNGFWSKELILEAGLQAAPLWVYILMLISAGLTAFYTVRMVSMVFYGSPASAKHVHDAQTAMKTALVPLAIGALTSWLLGGSFSQLLHQTLPDYEIHAVSTLDIILEVVKAPATWLALAVVALGIAAWFMRTKLSGLSRVFQWLVQWAQNSFGFEKINQWIVSGTQSLAESLRVTQTGMLNWNIAGILIGFILAAFILMIGG